MKFINIISHLAKAAFVVAFIFICCISTAWAQTPSGNWNDWVNDNNIDWSSDEAKAAAIPQSDDGSTVYISTAEQLAYYAYAVNNDKMTSGSASGYYCGRTVELMADIDLSEHYWKPIGWNKNYYFNGYFHGNGHVITGIHVNGDPKSDDTQAYPCYGLFGYLHKRSVGTSTITDLVLKDFSITASYSGNNMSEFYLGGLVGRCDDNTAITNCLLVNGSVSKSVSNICAHIGKVAGGGSPSTATANYYHNVSVSGWNDGFDTYSQQTIGGETEARAVALTISGTHGSVALGGTVGRISGGIIYAPANETVTLNTTADAGYQFDGYAATGLTIASGQFTMPDNDDGTITATFSINPAHFSDDGGDEYTIHTAAGWGVFCDLLAEANGKTFFSGKTVKLGDDIGSAENPVTRMAGSSYHDFTGTFDGNGKTLTVQYGSYGNPINEENVAPFRNAEDGCIIKNLHVNGNIYTSNKYAAGLIGTQYGTVSIQNCRVSVNINSAVHGDGIHGGLVGLNGNYGANLTIDGCVFDGKILSTSTTNTTNCGGFVGWQNTSVTITNSLYAPSTTTNDREVESTGCATFSRNGATITNSYYTRALGTAQGKAPHTVAAAAAVTIEPIALTGDATQYTVSGITAYSGGGLQRGETLYYGSDDQVSLTLGHTDMPLGYDFGGYSASAGTLSGTENPYTLTMPDADVTVSAELKYILQVDDDCDTEDDGYYYINMPKTGSQTFTIPSDIKSFKVYDDGGKDGYYSNGCDGTLTLTAPVGYVLKLTGRVTSQSYENLGYYYDYLQIYNGINTSAPQIGDKKYGSEPEGEDLGTLFGGQSVTLYFYSDKYNGQYSGLDITVSVVLDLQYTITITDLTNGKITANKTTGYYNGEEVTLTVTPDENYTLKNLTVKTGDVNVGTQKNDDGTYSFIMPDGDVTVSAEFMPFVNELTIYGDSEDEVKFEESVFVSNVTYYRTVTQGIPTTIILPFDFTAKDFGGKFYTFNGVDESKWTAVMPEVAADENDVVHLYANTPYIFKPSETVENKGFTFSNVTIQPTTGGTTTTIDDWEFHGTYEKVIWNEDKDKTNSKTTTDVYGFAAASKENTEGDQTIAAGDFVRAGYNVSIKPTRAYLKYTGENQNPQKSALVHPDRIKVVFIDKETASVIDDPTVNPSADEDGDITTPTSEIQPTANVKVWSYDKTIFIQSHPGTDYRIIDASGRPLRTSTTQSDRDEIHLGGKADGIVIVIIGGKAYKIRY